MILQKRVAYNIISDLAEKNTDSLSIGLTPKRGIGMFLSVYPHFYQAYLSIKVFPREISVMKQLEMIREEALDIGFITIAPKSITKSGLMYRTILQEQFVLAVQSTHPLASRANPHGAPRARIDLTLFRGNPFVLVLKESTQRALIDPLFAASGFQPNTILETASNHTLIPMVEKGLSCAIVPDYYTEPSEKTVCFDRVLHRACLRLLA